MSNENENDFSHIKEESFGMGSGIAFGFKDFDDFARYLGKKEREAMARILPEQERMIDCEKEQFFINIAVDLRELFIAGEAWSLSRARKEELASYKVESVTELSDEDKECFNESTRMMWSSRKRGYIFGRAYSEIEPRGELGSTHVTCMWPIPEAAFKEAKEQNWRPDLSDETKSPYLRRTLFQLHLKIKRSVA
jgi:hypothetical protein